MKYKLFLLVSLIVCAQCSRQQKDHIIYVDVSSQQQMLLSDYVKDVLFVPLENNKEYPIGIIKAVSVFNDRLYVVDESSNSLQIFDMNGKFIERLSKIGHGPDEYMQLSAMKVDVNGIYILDYPMQKLLWYDFDFKLKSKTKLDVYASDFKIIEDDILLYGEPTGKNEDQFYVVGRDGKQKYSGVKRFMPQGPFTWVTSAVIFGDKQPLVAPRYSNCFYKPQGDKFIETISFDFGENTLPIDTDFSKIDNLDMLAGYVLRENVFEMGEYLLVDYLLDNNRRFFIYDTKNRTTNSGILTNDVVKDFRLWIKASSAGYLIDYIDASQLIEWFGCLPKEYPSLATVDENDNPIIVLYRIN